MEKCFTSTILSANTFTPAAYKCGYCCYCNNNINTGGPAIHAFKQRFHSVRFSFLIFFIVFSHFFRKNFFSFFFFLILGFLKFWTKCIITTWLILLKNWLQAMFSAKKKNIAIKGSKKCIYAVVVMIALFHFLVWKSTHLNDQCAQRETNDSIIHCYAIKNQQSIDLSCAAHK